MPLRKLLMLLFFGIPIVYADDLANENVVANNLVNSVQPSSRTASKERPSTAWKTAWLASVAFHGAGTAYDAYTSYHRGPYESSALLRSSDGEFGNKAIVIKTATFVGFTAAQWLIVRKWPRMTKLFVPVNTFLGITYVHAGRHNVEFLATHH